MIRSVNIFKGTDSVNNIRVEFWEDDKLIHIYEVCNISAKIANLIAEFITKN